jgi:hypothetical protein
MRFVLAIIFVVFFVGSLGCGILLGGPPSSVYEFSDLIIGVAEGLLFLASLVLIALVFGIGSEGKKRSVWRLPLVCLAASLLGLLFGVAILTSKMENLTPQHAALNLRLMIYAGTMIVFALFSGLCMLLSYFLAKRHNGKLPPAA